MLNADGRIDLDVVKYDYVNLRIICRTFDYPIQNLNKLTIEQIGIINANYVKKLEVIQKQIINEINEKLNRR